MKHKKIILCVVGGIVILAGVMAWLVFGSTPISTKLDLGHGITATVNPSMKNSRVQRDKDGERLWEFTVAELTNDPKKNIAHLKGIKGRVYRHDGSYFDVEAEKGTANMAKNDFTVEGNVKFILNTGGELYADKVNWLQNKKLIIAKGHVKVSKDEWKAEGNEAETTEAFEKFKLKGKAMVEKGGIEDDEQK